MIINKQGETFEYEGKKYIVGEDVYATESSYYGLIGVIKEIRTGEDKDTDNPEPDIYCDFFEPVLEADKERLYQTFGNYYALDGIIMAQGISDFLTGIITLPFFIRFFKKTPSTAEAKENL